MNKKPRPMIGLLSQLTQEQRKAILEYRGPVNFGDKKFLLRNTKKVDIKS